jgi:hypothetical protein
MNKEYPHIPKVKPTVSGPVDGNIYAVIGAAKLALYKARLSDSAMEMSDRALNATSYHDALAVIQDYVEFKLSEY